MSLADWTEETTSVEETERIGFELAASLSSGSVLLLSGPLGAGKSALASGVARGLGARQWLGSPTFTIVHEYDTRPNLYHVDLYRLTSESVEELGLEEYIHRSSIVLIEWPERARRYIDALAGSQTVNITLEIVAPTSRKVRIWRPPGALKTTADCP